MKKLIKLLVIPILIIIFCFGMNSFASLHSKWSAGDLVFYDGATDIFVIRDGTDGVKIFDDLNLTFGTDNDATIEYDEDGTNKLILTCSNGFTLDGAVGITGVIDCTDTTEASAIGTAAIISDGGISCAKQLWVGDDINLSDSTTGVYDIVLKANQADALSIKDSAADMMIFDTSTGAHGITLVPEVYFSGASGANFRNSNSAVYSSGEGRLYLYATADITLAAPTTVIASVSSGTLIDVEMWAAHKHGIIFNSDWGAVVTFDDDFIGMLFDFNTNVTMLTDKDVTVYQAKLPAFTQSAANTTLITGFDLPVAGALVQDTLEGTITWKGLNLQLPDTTQTTGTVNAYGIYITPGTINSGTQIGLHIGGAMSTGIEIGAITIGIDFTGTLATGINFCDATFLPTADRSDLAIAVGSRANALTITLANENTQHFEPIQVNVDVAGVNPSSTSDVSLMRMQSIHSTAAMGNLRLRHINSYMVIEQDIQAAYIYTGSLDLATNAIAVTTEVAVMNLNLECASVVTGKVRGAIINMYGANLANADSIGLEVRTDGGASILDEGIRIWSVGGNSITTALDVRGTVTYFADFDNASGAAGTVCTESGTEATIWAGRIKVQTPDGNDAWVNAYSTSNE